MFSFGSVAENFEVFENDIFDCKVLRMVSTFLAFVVQVGIVTAEASQSEKLREWNGVFYVLWMRGRMQQIVMRISRFVVYASR